MTTMIKITTILTLAIGPFLTRTRPNVTMTPQKIPCPVGPSDLVIRE